MLIYFVPSNLAYGHADVGLDGGMSQGKEKRGSVCNSLWPRDAIVGLAKKK